jgi:hypothetical protein
VDAGAVTRLKKYKNANRLSPETPPFPGAFFLEDKLMAANSNSLEMLSTRTGFNSAVRYIKKTITLADTLGADKNLGDLLFEAEDEELSGERIGPLLRILLVDKLGYRPVSSNLPSVTPDPPSLAAEFEKWKAVDLVAAYHHPDMGLLAANPKSPEGLANFGALRKRELLVIYAGGAGGERCEKAALLAAALFEGKKPKIPAELYTGPFAAAVKKCPPAAQSAPPRKRAAKTGAGKPENAAPPEAALRESPRAAAPAGVPSTSAITKGPVRMTPMYSVVVQNELFHNGNVEAWKRIVAGYKAKYPALEVYIYYEGERILDINSLFKWGKVKHGSAIQFAVAGNEIRDVARLRRYLAQGASSRFEAFLRGPVSGVLNLF